MSLVHEIRLHTSQSCHLLSQIQDHIPIKKSNQLVYFFKDYANQKKLRKLEHMILVD